ncbi:MAG: tRNA (N(6)-L-threonylcarbamoyladenosine(37)-C(2))-methylthiotransferase MtaB [Acidobacteriia bacterium]|nr:tRNA (N(6)-L-threonylcarbamoyladenosine(37)-C(2))-methylthiotransferase MtaB [Terriglobia bacterium]
MESSAKFFLCTFGCRCNQADSAEMRARLCEGSLRESDDHRDADLIVVNSCTVTRRADQQVRQTVRRLHRENPGARIVIAGCYAERDPETLAAIPGVNLVLGNADRIRLAEVWRSEAGPGGRIIRTPIDAARDCLIDGASHIGGKTRPFLKLQDGCDARCTYCIVPSVRGPGRSALPEDILAAIRRLVDHGYQEIVLTGVHLGSYGRKLSQPIRLTDLLQRILEVPGLGRLRLSSIEPMRFDRGIVALAAQYPAFAPHFHIPLQSGSDRILRLMRRPYRAADFLDLLQYIHSSLPTVGLGTDVLVGFPGETVDDFEATCELVRQSPLTYLHVFPFSARPGTEASFLPGEVPPGVLHERCEILRELSMARNLAFRQRFVGKVLPAISLAKAEQLGESVALTDNYIHARITGPAIPANRLIHIRIGEVLPEGTKAAFV